MPPSTRPYHSADSLKILPRLQTGSKKVASSTGIPTQAPTGRLPKDQARGRGRCVVTEGAGPRCIHRPIGAADGL